MNMSIQGNHAPTSRPLAGSAAASITGIALPVDGGWTAH